MQDIGIQFIMRKKQISLFGMFLIVSLACIALAPVNRNTVIQVWHTFNPSKAPSGGVLLIGGIKRDIPFDYGDTWISRYYRVRKWFCSEPYVQCVPCRPRTIVVHEEIEEFSANSND
jgi:hypothetical protein